MTFTLDEMQECADALEWGEPTSKPKLTACTFLYFIGEGTRGAVKIGRSTDPGLRHATMQIGNSRQLVVLGLIANGDEGRWHKRFENDRIAGEWFRRTPALVSAIDEARTHMLAAHVRDGRTRRVDRIVPIEAWTPQVHRDERRKLRALRGGRKP